MSFAQDCLLCAFVNVHTNTQQAEVTRTRRNQKSCSQKKHKHLQSADTQHTSCETLENVTSGRGAVLEDYKQTTADKSQLRQMKYRWKEMWWQGWTLTLTRTERKEQKNDENERRVTQSYKVQEVDKTLSNSMQS